LFYIALCQPSGKNVIDNHWKRIGLLDSWEGDFHTVSVTGLARVSTEPRGKSRTASHALLFQIINAYSTEISENTKVCTLGAKYSLQMFYIAHQATISVSIHASALQQNQEHKSKLSEGKVHKQEFMPSSFTAYALVLYHKVIQLKQDTVKFICNYSLQAISYFLILKNVHRLQHNKKKWYSHKFWTTLVGLKSRLEVRYTTFSG
jgi:hypothetical protein